jgi:tetratricopeptide (TPR) repeat protein
MPPAPSPLGTRGRTTALLSAAALFATAIPAHSQSTADRMALDAFRDTLASVDDTASLPKPGEWRGSRNVTLVHEALALLRRGELEGTREPYDVALRRLEKVLDDDSDLPYSWYALGLTRLAMSSKGLVVKATPYHGQGISYRRAAMDAFARAIKADSSFYPASEALAGLVVAMGHRLLDQDLTAPLRRAATAAQAPATVPLALFRLEYGGGRYDHGPELLADYLRRGGDSGVARLEQARTLQALGRGAEAPAVYMEGPRTLGEEGRQEYRSDLAWVAADWELAEYDSLPGSHLASWVAQFWQERDALALRTPGERLAEHLRRWVFVHQNYLMHRPDDAPTHVEGQTSGDQQNLFTEHDEDVALVMTNLSLGTGGFATYHRTQWEMDDRGVIYLRHGEPTAKAINPSGPPNESWAYDLPDGRRVFHFIGSRALGTAAATTLTAALPPDPGMLDSRAGLDSRYAGMAADLQRRIAQARTERELLEHKSGPGARLARMDRAAAGRTGAAAAVEAANLPGGEWRSPASALRPETIYREIESGRTAIAASVTTDGFPQHFKSDLDAVVQVYAVGFAEGETRRVLTVFAVPGRKLVPRPRPDGGPGLLYPISLRLIAMDREHGVIRQLDTVRTYLTRDTLKGNQHLTGFVELTVPAGRYQIRTLVTSPGLDAATGAGRDSVDIPLSPRDLVLSDLILGREQSGLSWSYGGSHVALNPLNTYPRGADADLFYEVGGLLPGTPYQITMALRKPRDKPDTQPVLEAGFEFTATAKYQQVTRGLGLANLKPGAYLLQVTVKEVGSGREVSRGRALNILEQ